MPNAQFAIVKMINFLCFLVAMTLALTVLQHIILQAQSSEDNFSCFEKLTIGAKFAFSQQ